MDNGLSKMLDIVLGVLLLLGKAVGNGTLLGEKLPLGARLGAALAKTLGISLGDKLENVPGKSL